MSYKLKPQIQQVSSAHPHSGVSAQNISCEIKLLLDKQARLHAE